MRLDEVKNPVAERLFRQVALHFASIAPTKFRERHPDGIESGDWNWVSGSEVGKYLEIYIPHHSRPEVMVTVHAHGGPDFKAKFYELMMKWPNIIHSSDDGGDLGVP